MADTNIPSGIILYHYPFSPYARRIVWYLQLRRIPYAQCLQPPVMPRPDLATLGISYRRIPLLSINGSLYADTRLILTKLDALFPPSAEHPALPATPTSALLSIMAIEGGVFARAAQLMPASLPVWKDQKFIQDRSDFAGAPFSAEAFARIRPEALAHMRKLYDVYEALLADGREWIDGGEGPGMGEIEGVWPLHWMAELGSLPAGLFGTEKYPKTNAWIARWNGVVKGLKAPAVKVKGADAAKFILGAKKETVPVESADPLGLKEGTQVLLWPTDSGSKHKDQGRLVGLTKDEVVIAVKTKVDPSKEIQLHAPRVGFRIMPASAAKL